MAVKVVDVGTVEQVDAAAREVAVLGRVAVEGLVGFHEAIGLAGEPGAVALVLDRVRGGSLEGVVGARGHLSVGEAVTVLAPVARTLAGLHALGVVHADVTPGNVLLERTGRPLLADLGVARIAGQVPGDVHGTPGFVAPEVLDHGLVGTPCDVYAVGALAWWCVTGSAPEPLPLRRPLRELAPWLPEAFLAVTLAALSGDPADRPPAAELALAYFDSAPCEPLRLVVGTDETSLLTQRLRHGAPVSRQEHPPLTDRGRAPRVRGWHGGTIQARRLRALAVLAVLVAGLVAGGLVAGGGLERPGWLPPPRRDDPPRAAPVGRVGVAPTRSAPTPTPTPTPTRAPAPAAPARPAAAAELHGAAASDPRAVMQALADLRALAMNTASTADLALLDAPGSPAWVADSTALAAMTDSGQRYRRVALRVVSATAVSVGATRATLEVRVDAGPYEAVGPTSTRTHPAASGDVLRFVLVWLGGRWRIESVAASA